MQPPLRRPIGRQSLTISAVLMAFWTLGVLPFAVLPAAAQSPAPPAQLPPEPGPVPGEPALPRLNDRPQKPGLAALPALTAADLALNLAPIADWSPQAPFLDHFKTARPWIGHRPGRWGGADEADLAAAGYLGAQGWPVAIPPELSSIGTVILTDLPPEAQSLAGRYVLRYAGQGIVEVAGRATNVRYAPGEVQFDFTPGPGAVEIRIQRTDPNRDGDNIRAISVVQARDLTDWEAGALFNPRWLDRIEGVAALRLADWMGVHHSNRHRWSERPQLGDYTWARDGVPLEVLLALANSIGADPWFALPHRVSDAYVRAFATEVAEGLDPDLTIYAEFSSALWDGQSPQGRWAEAGGLRRWGETGLGLQFAAGRAAEVAAIWQERLDDAAADRLVNVLSVPTLWPGAEAELLEAPRWTKEQAARKAPVTFFDAYAVHAYFGAGLGQVDRAAMVRAWMADSTSRARRKARALGLGHSAEQAFVANHRHDIAAAQAAMEVQDGLISGDATYTLADLLNRLLPYHADIARKNGLTLLVAEGGSHVVGQGHLSEDSRLTEFFTHFNYSPEMAALYEILLEGWKDLGGGLFAAYSDVSLPSAWGSWGHLRWLEDQNPRWQVLTEGRHRP